MEASSNQYKSFSTFKYNIKSKASSILVKLCKMVIKKLSRFAIKHWRVQGGAIDRMWGWDKWSVLPLEDDRCKCSASGQLGPWGPAGLRTSFLRRQWELSWELQADISVKKPESFSQKV